MERKTKTAALFDFDGTLIRGDSVVRFVLFALRRSAMPRRDIPCVIAFALFGKLGLCPMERVKERALRFEKNLPRPEKEKLCRDFASLVLTPALFPEGRKAWDSLKAAGRTMVLASASTSDYMEYVAERLGADALICTRVSEDGKAGPNCRGEEKARRAAAWARENGADLKLSDAYGDSGGDIPLLRLCGRAHVVNPKRKLKKEAARRGWEVLNWK